MDCPECRSSYTVKNGKKERSYSTFQSYYCNSCGTYFTDKEFQNKSYSANVILQALKLYNQGFTLKETSKHVNKRFGVNTSTSTIYNWYNEYKALCGYRAELNNSDNIKDQVVFEKVFEHNGLDYRFMYHKQKLNRAEDYFPNLTDFISNVKSECPNHLFNSENALRSSQTETQEEFEVKEFRNNACELADLGLKAVNNRRKRHDKVQDLMLKTDKATVATELPVWYYNKDLEDTVTGHIDILQTRNNRIHVLDYKPNAEKVEPVSQLRNYVKALSYRTGVLEDKFKAAWFNEKVYREIRF